MSAATEYTPGPWRVRPHVNRPENGGDTLFEIGAGKESRHTHVSMVSDSNPSGEWFEDGIEVVAAGMDRDYHFYEGAIKNEADAHLIGAAPDLDSACRESFVDISAVLTATTWELAPEVRAQLQKTAAKCESAFRKARGGE